MTIRAWIFGILLALGLAWLGFYHDAYIRATYLVGNHLPVSVFGVLILIVLVVNPILRGIRFVKPFRGSELAVIFLFLSVVCVIPGSGFLRTFAPILVMPHHWEKQSPSWNDTGVLSYIPRHVILDVEGKEDRVVEAFVDGHRRTGQAYSIGHVPWESWLPTLRYWVPLTLLIFLASIGMGLILHRQWSTHEHLSYPIAQFATFLSGRKRTDKESAGLLKERGFWYGFIPVFLLYLNNGIHAYFPKWPEFSLIVNFWPLGILWPQMTAQVGAYGVFGPTLNIAVIAFAYFLPSAVTFSLGISVLASVIMGAVAMEHGIRLSNSRAGAGNVQGFQFGAFLGMTLMILYTGRNFFRRVVLAGFGLNRGGEPIEPSCIWGFRVMVLCGTAAAWWMTRMGLDWPIAVLMTLAILMLYAVLARISAETGVFFVQAWWQPGGVLLGFLGSVSLGPQAMLVAVLISLVLTIDPRECLLPFMINAFRVCEDQNVKRGRMAVAASMILVIGLIGAVGISLILQYNDGMADEGWAGETVPRMAPDLVSREIETMTRQGTLEKSTELRGVSRLTNLKPDKEFQITALIGLLLILGCAFGRLRFPKWPFHPVLFLVWLTFPLHTFSFSFLVGWMIKTAVVSFGGANFYQRHKPLAVGAIAGQILAALVFMAIAALYYFHHGYPAPYYRVFPG